MKPTSIRLRSGTLDTIRGLTLVSMIVYHACWDLVYLYRLDWGWYRSFWAGFYLYRLRPETPAVPDIRLPGIGAIGRRSLMVYLLHQPVIYGLLALIFSLQEVHLCLS